MSNHSPERQAIAHLVATSGVERGERFDPRRTARINGGQQDREVYLQQTVALPAVQNVGNYTVAVYSDKGPGLPEDYEGILHHGCDAAVLLRRTETATEEFEAAAQAEPRRLNPSLAWAFELLQPAKPDSDQLRGTGQSVVFLPTA